MNVKDLIEELQKFEDDVNVYFVLQNKDDQEIYKIEDIGSGRFITDDDPIYFVKITII